MNKRVRPIAEHTDEGQKRIKIDDDEDVTIGPVKKKKPVNKFLASSIDEKTKKMKVWSEKNKVSTFTTILTLQTLRSSGQEYKAKRELDQSLQNFEELGNVDNAQLDLNQEAYDRELRRIEISNGIKEGALDPKVYRGNSGYASYFDRNENDLKKKQFNGTLGPTQQANYVKESIRMDHNPERCKDYFETGHCAFGDTCIFIHDRSDYASGHQQENDWNEKQRKLHKKLMGKKYNQDSDGDDDESENEKAVSEQHEELDEEGLPLK